MFSICCNSRVATVKTYPPRITKIKPFIKKHKWKGKNFSGQKDNSKKIENNNVTISLIFCKPKKKKIYPAYVSKHNSDRKKQIILLLIPNGEG